MGDHAFRFQIGEGEGSDAYGGPGAYFSQKVTSKLLSHTNSRHSELPLASEARSKCEIISVPQDNPLVRRTKTYYRREEVTACFSVTFPMVFTIKLLTIKPCTKIEKKAPHLRHGEH